MKASDKFKSAIEDYLNAAAQGDAVFAQHLAKTAKNLESCFNYIFGEVKKAGFSACAFDNQEIFDMAVKYYTDDTIGQPPPVKCTVAVSPPAAADLFTAAPEVPKSTPAPKAAVPAAKSAPKTLTLFDL